MAIGRSRRTSYVSYPGLANADGRLACCDDYLGRRVEYAYCSRCLMIDDLERSQIEFRSGLLHGRTQADAGTPRANSKPAGSFILFRAHVSGYRANQHEAVRCAVSPQLHPHFLGPSSAVSPRPLVWATPLHPPTFKCSLSLP